MPCRKCKKSIPLDSLFCQYCGAKQAVEVEHKTKSRGNGTGSVYRLPNGKWRVEITLGYEKNGEKDKRIYKTKSGFKTKKEGLEYLASISTGTKIDSNIKFNALYEEWSAQHYKHITKSGEYGYVAAYKQCADLYYKCFTELKTRDLQAVIDKCKNQRRSKADIKSLLNNMYNYAIQNDYCDKNYAEFIKLPPKRKSKNDAFNAEEIEKLWDDYAAGNEFTSYILIMIYTGMRFGELSTIKKENVFLDKKYMIGGIKTNAGIDREIPIADKILPIVKKLFESGNKKLLEIPEKLFYNKYHATIERLKIRSLNPHCCRHTFSSLMAQAGIQPAIITETAGHEDYSTTMLYTHIQLEEKIKAVNKL